MRGLVQMRALRSGSPRARTTARRFRALRADRRPARLRECCRIATRDQDRSPHPIQPARADTSSVAPRAQRAGSYRLQPARARSQEHERLAGAFHRAGALQQRRAALHLTEHDASIGRDVVIVPCKMTAWLSGLAYIPALSLRCHAEAPVQGPTSLVWS